MPAEIEPLPDTESAAALTLDFPAFRTVRCNFLSFMKFSGSGCFVIAAHVD